MERISFNDLQAQQSRIRKEINAAINRVLEHGQYILGPEVVKLEKKLAEFTGGKHVITCSSGTDALLLILLAHKLCNREAVFVPSFNIRQFFFTTHYCTLIEIGNIKTLSIFLSRIIRL